MQGSDNNTAEGILHMAANDIFQLISQTSDRDFLLRVSFVEIYNEIIRDLLDPETPTLQIREDPRKGVYIDAYETIITDFESILTALKTGSKNRRVEATSMNERSSRSHTIFRMVLESKERGQDMAEGVDPDVDGAVLVATLNLVDLAGSESVRHTGATGQRAKEGGKINQSLLTLSRVIHALGQEGSVHVNFRDSKLTRILQPSLSGNAKMAVVCCVTPADRYLEETRSTLQFASRAKMVRTNAVVNEVLDDQAQLKRLKKELQELKEKQKVFEESGTSMVSMEDVNRLEAQKEAMTGKVVELEAELEAVREDHANKIARLTNLIMQGGDVIAATTQQKNATRRRHKRLRETWCPGESGIPLPPGAALQSVKELAEDDEADDRLVSSLSFGRATSVGRQSLGAKARMVMFSGLSCLSEESSSSGGGGKAEAVPENDPSREALRLQELLAMRESTLLAVKKALSEVAGHASGDAMEEDDGAAILSMVQNLTRDYQAQAAGSIPDSTDAAAGMDASQWKDMLESASAEAETLRTQLDQQQCINQTSIEEASKLRSRMEAAVQEATSLKEALEASKLSESAKAEEVESLVSIMREMRSQLEAMPSEEDIQSRIDQAKEEVACEARKAEAVADEALKAAQELLKSRGQEVAALHHKLSEMEAHNAGLSVPEDVERQLTEMTSQLESLKQSKDAAEERLAAMAHDLEESRLALEAQERQWKEEMVNVKKSLEATEQLAGDRATKIEDHLATIQKMQEQDGQRNEEFEALKEALSAAETLAQSQGSEAEKHVVTIGELQGQEKEWQERVESMQEANAALEAVANERAAEIEKHMRTIEELQGHDKELQEQLITTLNSLKAAEDLIQARTSEVERHVMSVEELQRQVESTWSDTEAYEALKKEKQALEEALSAAEERAQQHESGLESLKKSKEATEEQLGALANSLDESKAALNAQEDLLNEKLASMKEGLEVAEKLALDRAAEIEDHLITIGGLQEREKKWQSRIESMQEAAVALEAMANERAAVIEDYVVTIKQLQRQVESMSSDTEAYQALKQEKQALEEALSAVEASALERVAELDALKQSMEAMEEKAGSLAHALDESKASLEEQGRQSQEQVKDLKKALSVAEGMTKESARQVEDHLKIIEVLLGQLEGKSGETEAFEALLKEKQAVEMALSSANAAAREKEEEVARLTQGIQGIQNALEKIQRRAAELQQVEGVLREQAATAEATAETWRKEAEGLGHALSNAKQEIGALNEQLVLANTQSSEAFASSEAVGKEIEFLRETVQILEGRLQSQANENALDKSAFVSHLEEEVNALRGWLNMKGVDSMEPMQADDYAGIISELRSSLSTELSSLRAAMEEAKADISSLKEQLEMVMADNITSTEGYGKPMLRKEEDPTAMAESENGSELTPASKRQSSGGDVDSDHLTKKARRSSIGQGEIQSGVDGSETSGASEECCDDGESLESTAEAPIQESGLERVDVELEERLRVKEEECITMTEDLEASHRVCRDTEARLEQALAEIEAQQSELLSFREEQTEKMTTMKCTIQSLEEQIMAKDTAIRELSVEAGETQGRVVDTSDSTTQTKSDHEESNRAVRLENPMQELTVKLETATSEDGSSSEGAEPHQKIAFKSQSLLINEQNARSEVERALKEAQDSLLDLGAQLKHSKEQVVKLLEAQEEGQQIVKRETERRISELAAKDAELAHLHSQISKLNEDLAEAQSAINIARAEQDGAASHDEGLRKRVSQLQTQLDLVQSTSDKQAVRIKELEQENNRLVRDAENDAKRLNEDLAQAKVSGQSMASMQMDLQRVKEACKAGEEKLVAARLERDDAEAVSGGDTHIIYLTNVSLPFLTLYCIRCFCNAIVTARNSSFSGTGEGGGRA